MLTDITYGVIKPHDDKFKTSMLAITKVAKAYGVDLRLFKARDDFEIRTPMILCLNREHYVTVSWTDGDLVLYYDQGRPAVVKKSTLIESSSGFFATTDHTFYVATDAEEVPDNIASFIWG